MELVNRTPFVLGRAVFLDKKAAEHLVVALKATFSIGESGALVVAEKQEPLKLTDEFHGEPDSSSIKQEAELGPVKPATDVLLVGNAVAPQGVTRYMEVSIRVGPLEQRAIVFGDRFWTSTAGSAGISAPQPFDAVPLVWERGFGGTDLTPGPEHRDHEPRNPVGVGFRAKKSSTPWMDTPLPNIENPAQLLSKPGQRVPPVGFGPVGRNWEPRVRYVGTYDEQWMQRRMPLLPEDFDDRFHNAAPPGLVAAGYLGGSETVDVMGCSSGGRFGFTLPGIRPQVAVRVSGQLRPVEMQLNTITVDMGQMQLRLLWKGDLPAHGEIMAVSQIECRVAERR